MPVAPEAPKASACRIAPRSAANRIQSSFLNIHYAIYTNSATVRPLRRGTPLCRQSGGGRKHRHPHRRCGGRARRGNRRSRLARRCKRSRHGRTDRRRKRPAGREAVRGGDEGRIRHRTLSASLRAIRPSDGRHGISPRGGPDGHGPRRSSGDGRSRRSRLPGAHVPARRRSRRSTLPADLDAPPASDPRRSLRRTDAADRRPSHRDGDRDGRGHRRRRELPCGGSRAAHLPPRPARLPGCGDR